VDHRSSIKQVFVLKHAALAWAAFASFMMLASAGCQTGAQQDLVARELRMQEDQIYAMEDYLSQYQQLVCKYRSENAALRRRLADDYYDGQEAPEPRTTPPPDRDGPALGEPPAQQNRLDLPDVPPLEGGAEHDVDDVELDFKPSLIAQVSSVEPIDEPASGEPASAGGLPVAPAPAAAAPHQVSLHGEVVANESGGGPRLAVDVEPLDTAGRGIPFNGELSLMLLARQPDGGEQSLARWDYGPDDVASALDSEAGRHVMRFYLELPPDTPIADNSQIWVRLVPPGRDKVLAHAPIQLDRPGQFASHVEEPTATPIPVSIAANLIESEWTIARPGQPANLPKKDDDPSGGWRTSSEPIPAVVQVSTAPEALSRPIQQVIHTDPVAPAPPPVYKPPTWSPDRQRITAQSNAGDGEANRQSVASRPAWSATR